MNPRVYRMDARATAAERTGSRIVDAMLARFARDAYDRIRLEDVASDAGVTVQTVIRRFGGKAGLMRATVERELGRIEGSRASAHADGPERLVADLVAHYEVYGALILKVYAEAGTVEGLRPVVDLGREHHLRWCREAFAPHLPTDLAPDVRERRVAQLTVACDATTWRILRHDCALGAEDVRVAVTELVSPLLEPGAPVA